MYPGKSLEVPLLSVPTWVFAGLLLIFVSLPSAYLFLWSVKGTSNVGVLGPFTLHWYSVVFHNPDWGYAAGYSILIALVSSTLSLSSTLMYFYFSIWHRRIYQSFGYLLLVGPLFFPTIVYGLALRIAFNSHGFPEWLPLIVGHTILMFPILYFLLESSNEFIQIEWIFSSVTMGASHWETIRYVVAPLLKRQILTAFGIGILLSFDEIVIASAVIDGSRVTIPKKMWDVVNRDMDPTPAVIATLVLATTMLILVVFRTSQRLREKY